MASTWLCCHQAPALTASARATACRVLAIGVIARTWERIALPFAKNLERLGVDARVRTVDTAQYQNRIDNFDFDMTV
jgi:ABC-type oligopeptide transport system substrate-binding subunit